MEITLPWFDRVLSPNSTKHWSVKHKAKKAQKATAYYLTKQAARKGFSVDENMLHITFHPPDNRGRDMDNNLASVKAAIDGVSEAIGVNDKYFGYTITKGEVVKGGKIVIKII
jgi:Holliday junction resolvase RusA-like endonuclease